MRVSRAEAEENRNRVIDVASRLFREKGFDGIGLADLMKGAGLTQGGFYKQFKSKEDLQIQACERAVAVHLERWLKTAANSGDNFIAAMTESYLSDRHCNDVGGGCPFVALGGDAIRHGAAMRAPIAAGVDQQLDLFDRALLADDGIDAQTVRETSTAILSMMVGALTLARITAGDAQSDRFLAVAKREIARLEAACGADISGGASNDDRHADDNDGAAAAAR